MKKRIVVASGYYDPIHTGHIEYLELARKYATENYATLTVIVNNDKQAALKKGKAFMTESERFKIVSSLRCVDDVILAIDNDPSVCATIEHLAKTHEVVAFAKGGDRFSSEIPEAGVCKAHGIVLVDGMGLKIQSSSSLIAAAASTDAPTPKPIIAPK